MDGLQTVRVRTGRVAEGVVDALAKPLIENVLTLHLGAVFAGKSVVSRLVFLCGTQLMSGLKVLCDVLQVLLLIFQHQHDQREVATIKRAE